MERLTKDEFLFPQDFPKLDKAIVHIGQPKSATKSIQHFLGANREALRAHGIVYPGRTVWHDRLASIVSGNAPLCVANVHSGLSEPDAILKIDRAFSQCLRDDIAGPRPHTILFSYEGLFCQPEEILHSLKAFLDTLAHETEIVAYIREPFATVASLYSTNALLGFPNGTRPEALRVDQALALYGAVFGDAVRVRPFERAQLHGQDIIADFLHTLDIPGEALTVPPSSGEKKNESISGLGVGLLEVAHADLTRRPSAFDFFKFLGKPAAIIPGTPYEIDGAALRRLGPELEALTDVLAEEHDLRFEKAGPRSTTENAAEDPLKITVAAFTRHLLALEREAKQDVPDELAQEKAARAALAEELAAARQDIAARRNPLAKAIDRWDYSIHRFLGQTRLFGESTRARFAEAADRRHRASYDT